MFTGNRGCLFNDDGRLVRHHNGSLWIICLTAYRDWQHPLDAPRTWTPLFFLDDAVALAAGHRPCGLCRRSDYLDYRQAVTTAAATTAVTATETANATTPVSMTRVAMTQVSMTRVATTERLAPADDGGPILAGELNRRLARERLRRGRGLDRARDRILPHRQLDDLPVGTVVTAPDDVTPLLVTEAALQPFGFDRWGAPRPRPHGATVNILTPPTSLAALQHGFEPTLHESANQ